MTKVSVIVPVYRVEKYIERCAKSLFEQSLDDIEYLFVDDCTPDDSINILRQVLEAFPQRKAQVIIHKMTQNSGQAAVRKWGMLNATGEYIIHCDSDDWVDTDMYRYMYEKAITEDADIVSCNYYKVEDSCFKEVVVPHFDGLLTGPLWNRLVRRRLYVENPFVFPVANKAEDGAIMVQLSFFANKKEALSLFFEYIFILYYAVSSFASSMGIGLPQM